MFLGERITIWKALAILLGIVGVAVIVRPATDHVEPGQLIALAAAFGFGISVAMVKSLTRTDSAVKIVFWMIVIQSAAGLLPCLWFWQAPSASGWAWILVIAFCGTYSHFCFARAMSYADATIVLPMDFVRVPLTATVGWLIYSERIDVYTAIGAAMILAANLINLRPPKAALEA
jgi:drug/metabolite transporter (DMT)-like permease